MTERKKRVYLLVAAAISAAGALAFTLWEVLSKRDDTAFILALGTAERILLFAAFAFAVGAAGFARLLLPRFKGGITAFIAALAVAVANFPFFTLGTGELVYTASAGVTVLYAAFCVSIGLFEETAFRALLIPLIAEGLKNRKGAPIIAILLSSGIFALAHLFNLFGGAGFGATLLQIGYTFLTGCMFGAIFVLARSVAAPAIAHTVYNIGGLLASSGMATGSQWNAPAIAVMVAVSVAAGVYVTFVTLRRTLFSADKYELIEDGKNKRKDECDGSDND